jgi:RNA polymerase sigma-B factor
VTGAPASEPQTVEEDTLRDDEFPTGRRGTEGEVASEEPPVVVPDPRSEVVPGPDAGTPVGGDVADEDATDADAELEDDGVTEDEAEDAASDDETATGDTGSTGAAPSRSTCRWCGTSRAGSATVASPSTTCCRSAPSA